MTKIAEDIQQVPRTQQQREAGQAPRQRAVFGVAQSKLQPTGLDPAYHYHWINDTPGRLEQAQAGGYTFVQRDEIALLPGVVPRNSDAGSQVSALVGRQENGDPLRAYLMKIPLDWYEEDQTQIQQRVDAVDQAIRQGKTSGQEDKNFYIPKGQSIRLSTKLEN